MVMRWRLGMMSLSEMAEEIVQLCNLNMCRCHSVVMFD